MAGIKLYPNQSSITILKQEDSELYAQVDMGALQVAMVELDGVAFKIWMYLARNKNRYEFALSPKAMEEWGIKKDAYYRAKKVLEEKGYLVEGKHGLVFNEYPVVKEEVVTPRYIF